jgi:hypothetical protein
MDISAYSKNDKSSCQIYAAHGPQTPFGEITSGFPKATSGTLGFTAAVSAFPAKWTWGGPTSEWRDLGEQNYNAYSND